MKTVTDPGKFRKRIITSKRAEFESLLHSTLLDSFLKININGKTAKATAEKLCQDNPEYRSSLKQIKFSENYFSNFFKRFGWKWGLVQGKKTYYPQDVLENDRRGSIEI